MLVFCIISIILGVVMLIRAKQYKHNHDKKRNSYIFTVIFFVIGIGMLIAQVFLSQHIQLKLWGVIAGGLLIYWGSIGIRDLIHCKWMVSGVCLNVSMTPSLKYGKKYTPKFRYHYQRHTYEKESHKGTEKANKFREGQIYSIFIDEKHPERVIWRKKIDFEDIIRVFLGVIFWVTCIFA